MGACISYTWYTAKEIPFTPELHRTFAAGCGSTPTKERLIHEDTAFSQLLPQLEVSRYRRRPGITLEMCLEGKIDA